MAWNNEAIVAVFVAATVVAVLFAPLSGTITGGTGVQSVENETVTASTSDYADLNGYHVQDGTANVTYLNSTSGSYETATEGTDYDVRHEPGTITANASGQITDGDQLRVSYDYAATDGMTTRIAGLIPLFLALLILVTIAGLIATKWG